MTLNVLHITNWYPNEEKPLDGIWIKKQIDSLSPMVKNDVFHLQIQPGAAFKVIKSTAPGFVCQIKSHRWMLIEWLTFLLLAYTLFFKIRLRDYHVINFHIAYPLCVYLRIIRKFIKQPVIINEHWSAYHHNFGVKDPRKLDRIRKIFQPDITIITVSEALAKDIRNFAGRPKLNINVVPNVVDTQLFRFDPKMSAEKAFLMAGNLKPPKDPLLALESFSHLLKTFPGTKLRIAGHGPLVDPLLKLIAKKGLEPDVTYLGILEGDIMAREMGKAAAFIHVSNYETFSVVCAEAVCCGTPVIASAVGGIPEFINNHNGLLLSKNNPENLRKLMEDVLSNPGRFDRESIATNASCSFNPQAIGKKYFKVLSQVCGL